MFVCLVDDLGPLSYNFYVRNKVYSKQKSLCYLQPHLIEIELIMAVISYMIQAPVF
jgi:hypothetical protein